jgi:hypothetical protein
MIDDYLDSGIARPELRQWRAATRPSSKHRPLQLKIFKLRFCTEIPQVSRWHHQIGK